MDMLGDTPLVNTKHHILVIDDDERLRALLVRFLNSKAYRVTGASSVAVAKGLIKNIVFDAFVVDVTMPGESGLDFVRHIKDQGDQTPCLMLTAMAAPPERLHGLKIGADDYMTKPFEPDELDLRIRNLLRWARGLADSTKQAQAVAEAELIRFGPHVYDVESGQLRTGNRRNPLTRAESDLLQCFIRNRRQVLTRHALKSMLTTPLEGRSLDVSVARLRRKIEPNPHRPIYLVTARGQGWMLDTDTTADTIDTIATTDN